MLGKPAADKGLPDSTVNLAMLSEVKGVPGVSRRAVSGWELAGGGIVTAYSEQC